MTYFILFFYRQTEQVLLTEKPKGQPKVYTEYTGEDQAYTKKKAADNTYHPKSSPKRMHKRTLPIHNYPKARALIKEVFNLESEKTASSKTTSFLPFQIAQMRLRGPAIQSFLALFLIGNPAQLDSRSLKEYGQTQGRPGMEIRPAHKSQTKVWTKRWSKFSSALPHKGHLLAMGKPSFSVVPWLGFSPTKHILYGFGEC